MTVHEPAPASEAAPPSAATPTSEAAPARDRPAGGGTALLNWVVVSWLTLLVALTTMFAVFFLPLYVGSVPLPISVAPAALVVFTAIRLSYRLTGSMRAAFAPAVAWLVTAMYLSFSRTFNYALVIGDWRATLLLGIGAVAAASGVALCWGMHQLSAIEGAGDGRSRPDVPVITAAREPRDG